MASDRQLTGVPVTVYDDEFNINSELWNRLNDVTGESCDSLLIHNTDPARDVLLT